MSDDKLTDVLPVTRVTPSLRERLERIAATSVTPRVSDHIRYAVQRYIESEENKQNIAPIVPPQVAQETNTGTW